MKQKIRFPKKNHKDFYNELSSRIEASANSGRLLQRAKTMLWVKFIIYSLLFISIYCLLLLANWQNKFLLVVNYVLFGLSGILLAFNAAHDSAHGTFSTNKTINAIIFRFTFNINGVNGYLWKKRHIASHHLFPNVDGCDADIDENMLLRLSPTHRKRMIHRFQHVYASFLYLFYTLQWIFFKDFRYLSKNNLSNIRRISHPKIEIARFFLWKCIYLIVYVFVPWIIGYDILSILLSFVIMHFVISIFFVWTLIISHLTLETAFPVQNESGELPYNFYEHQLATAMDYRPRGILMNWFLGGFNAHAAHHLFPKLPHTIYRHITYKIQRTAVEFGMPYHSKTFLGALRSHYAYLKLMGSH